MVETIEAQIQVKLGKYGKPVCVRPYGLRTITEDGCYFS